MIQQPKIIHQIERPGIELEEVDSGRRRPAAAHKSELHFDELLHSHFSRYGVSNFNKMFYKYMALAGDILHIDLFNVSYYLVWALL